MKRSAAVIGVTAAGLGFVLAYHPVGGGTTNLASLSSGSTVAGAQTTVGSDQQLAGSLGDIQVKVSAANGKIVNVGMAKMNLSGPQSNQISSSVIPQLEQQVLAANGGPIHGVSGATYTSQAFARSLQAALTQFTGGPNAALAANHGNGGVLSAPTGDDGGGRGD